MNENRKNYIPALSYDFLTPLYDPLIWLALRESVFKTALLQQASVQPGTRVLDLACGTGTLAIMAKKACPQAEVVGLDGDAKILEIARTKARGENVAVRFDEAFSSALPYDDDSFDRVISSLFFHHINREDKRRTLRELRRVLAPNGELHVADWDKPQNWLMKVASYPVRLFDGAATSDSFAGLLPKLIREAGFADVRTTKHFSTVLGTISFFKAKNSELTEAEIL
jgi:ubiquinone/menaquinone biosynthesis C-methylase UbiE